jgi:hypothetical protein
MRLWALAFFLFLVEAFVAFKVPEGAAWANKNNECRISSHYNVKACNVIAELCIH